MDENPYKLFRSAAKHIVLSMLRACYILMIIFGTLGVPFGAFIGAESGHDGPGPKTAAESRAKKKWAYQVMATSAFLAIAGATALYLADRRQFRKNTQNKIEFARQIHPPKRLPEGHDEPLLSPDSAPEPFQFRLRSIFLAAAAVALALGVLTWLGPFYMILAIQFGAVIAVLVKSKGSAWRGVIIGAILGGSLSLDYLHVEKLLDGAFFSSLAAWVGGGFAADDETKRQSLFLRWAWQSALVWLLAVIVASPVLQR